MNINRILLAAIISATCLACSSSSVEKLISEHEEVIDGVKSDLSLEIEELEITKTIKAVDSLIIYQEMFDKSKTCLHKLDSLLLSIDKIMLNSYKSDLKKYDKTWCHELSKEELKEGISQYQENINKLNKTIDSIKNNNFKGMKTFMYIEADKDNSDIHVYSDKKYNDFIAEIERIKNYGTKEEKGKLKSLKYFKVNFNFLQNKIEKYSKVKDSILAREYKCTYTIINPLLNGIKQTLTKSYTINSDETKILSVKNKDE